MKCLSLLQPWAQLVVLGKKCQETRSWDTKYRGILYIHASKNHKFAKEFEYQWPFAEYVDPEKIEFGHIIGHVTLWGTVTSEEALKVMQKYETEDMAEEFKFGDYSPGRFVWYLRDPIIFDNPIPARGALRLWNFNQKI